MYDNSIQQIWCVFSSRFFKHHNFFELIYFSSFCLKYIKYLSLNESLKFGLYLHYILNIHIQGCFTKTLLKYFRGNTLYITLYHSSITIRRPIFLLDRFLQLPTLSTTARAIVSSTRRKMTAKRGRAPVVTARAIAEWRFAYRKSEYNIGVLSVSALSRASDVTGVPGDHLVYVEIGKLRRRTRRLFTRRQHVSRRDDLP